MGSTLGDDDWASNASSEDELMEDVDPIEPDGDLEAEEDDEDDDEIVEDDDVEGDEDVIDQPLSHISKCNQNGHKNATNSEPQVLTAQNNTKSLKQLFYPRPEAITASSYDIVPTIAAPQGTSINAITATPDMRYWFSGGTDCYIRKYDGVATINGKALLTVAQRHPFVDSVVKAGVLLSYWDNEEPLTKSAGEDPSLSPVYSLAVHSEALWLLSGLESGSINLYSVRHDEGKRIAYMNQHKSAVSVLKLAKDEKSVLSGSWDKEILDWDLNTGQVKRSFEGSGGQISAIEVRPDSNVAISAEPSNLMPSNEEFSGYDSKQNFSNEKSFNNHDGDLNEDAHESQTDSLFGGSDTNSLFLEAAGDNPPSAGLFREEDNSNTEIAIDYTDVDVKFEAQEISSKDKEDFSTFGITKPVTEELKSPSEGQANRTKDHQMGIEDVKSPKTMSPNFQDSFITSDSTFLAASIDGTIRIWDRRQPHPVAFIPTRFGVPPWCMSACWSPDGNFLYAGRRNCTVEEFSIHHGLKNVERTLKFPFGSGAVSALRAMPNGRHLLCASNDILRLYDLKESQNVKRSTVPFLIVPGPPRAGVIAALHFDPTYKYMISIAGNRGWEGSTTEVLIGYEIGIPVDK
ncbi:Transcription factor spt8 [Erysiphe necator]|uniref:Putative transcription factor spt8 n=1 Tax=Uncinula necator TaxID=52586 RepID=A0A0B1NWJ7_UNCNE|nr:Transcription factor spt8 [Erysiphe necator]KHJ30737.1 putative transcription factor spt8 [Erysiphe necator]